MEICFIFKNIKNRDISPEIACRVVMASGTIPFHILLWVCIPQTAVSRNHIKHYPCAACVVHKANS